MKRSKEIKTAVLVLVSLALFIWGYNFLKGKNILNPHLTLFARYETVEGLQTSTPVTMNGIVIGRINAIEIEDKTGKPIVEIQINADFPISKSSIARIYDASMLGSKQVAIIPNLADKNMAKSGDFIASEIQMGLMGVVAEHINPLQKKLEAAIANIDVLVTNMNEVLDAQTKKNLQNSVAELQASLKNVNQLTGNANGLLLDNRAKLNATLGNVATASENFSKISDSLAKAGLGETVKKLDASVDNINKLLVDAQNGKGSLGKLMKDEGLYKNLTGASKELELLLADMKNNPKRYVHFSLFGKKAVQYQQPNDTIQ